MAASTWSEPYKQPGKTQTLHGPPAPAGVIEGSPADVSFIAGLLVDKFQWGQPLHRQHQRLIQAGFQLSRPWLTQLVSQLANVRLNNGCPDPRVFDVQPSKPALMKPTMHHRLSFSKALAQTILATCLAAAQPGQASAADAPARPREPVNVSGQFKGAKEAVQKISDALPQPLYDAIKSRNLSLMVYTKNFTFSNSKKNWCWAYVGITTPTTDGRTERLAPGATTGVFNTERDFDCRLNAVTGAISDGARLLQFAQSKELTMTVPAGKAPAEAKELLLFSTYDEQQNQWILNGVPPRFLAAFDVRQVRLMSGFERSVIGDDVLCVATAAVTAASPDDRTPRVPPELEVGTALLPGAARQKPADADCWKAAVGGAFTKLLSRPWDTGLLAGLNAAREDWSRLPTPDAVRAAVAKYDKAHPPSANGAR